MSDQTVDQWLHDRDQAFAAGVVELFDKVNNVGDHLDTLLAIQWPDWFWGASEEHLARVTDAIQRATYRCALNRTGGTA
jgi:hypothetical protein